MPMVGGAYYTRVLVSEVMRQRVERGLLSKENDPLGSPIRGGRQETINPSLYAGTVHSTVPDCGQVIHSSYQTGWVMSEK